MDQLRGHARMLLTVLFISQVCGSPTFYWSQPDCYQNNEDSYNNYDSYQGPSYQETLRDMVAETLKAVSEIVQITVSATKQELAALSKILYQKLPSDDCSPAVDLADASDDYQINDSPGQVYPGQFMDNDYTNPLGPPKQSPVDVGALSTTEEKMCTSETPLLGNKGGVENNTPSVSPVVNKFANNQSIVKLETPESSHENQANPTSTSSLGDNMGVELNNSSASTEPESSVNALADELATLSFTTGESTTLLYATETTTSDMIYDWTSVDPSTTTSHPTTGGGPTTEGTSEGTSTSTTGKYQTSEDVGSTTGEVTTKAPRKPKL